MIILVDMDNTLADFDKGLLEQWRNLYPKDFFVPLESRRNFHPYKDYPDHLQARILAICHSEGFIRTLSPIPGGIEAVQEMIARGHEVRFCTSHLAVYDHCLVEKYQWVERYFGRTFVDRIVMTYDKTLIQGDLLIDDKPEIMGLAKPVWEHIVYDRPHNRHVADKRRVSWEGEWQSVVFGARR